MMRKAVWLPVLAYERRDALSAILTVAMAGFLLAGAPVLRSERIEPVRAAEDRMELALLELPTPLRAGPQPPLPVSPAPPKPRVKHQPPGPTPPVRPAPMRSPTAAPVQRASPAPTSVAAPEATEEPSAATATPPEQAPASTRRGRATEVSDAPDSEHLNKDYERKIRTLVESKKQYPTSRQASIEKPTGKIALCVMLGRSGNVRSVDVSSSSGSLLLDNAAVRLVESLSYPAFGEASFPGEPSHVFCMTLDYQLPSS